MNKYISGLKMTRRSKKIVPGKSRRIKERQKKIKRERRAVAKSSNVDDDKNDEHDKTSSIHDDDSNSRMEIESPSIVTQDSVKASTSHDSTVQSWILHNSEEVNHEMEVQQSYEHDKTSISIHDEHDGPDSNSGIEIESPSTVMEDSVKESTSHDPTDQSLSLQDSEYVNHEMEVEHSYEHDKTSRSHDGPDSKPTMDQSYMEMEPCKSRHCSLTYSNLEPTHNLAEVQQPVKSSSTGGKESVISMLQMLMDNYSPYACEKPLEMEPCTSRHSNLRYSNLEPTHNNLAEVQQSVNCGSTLTHLSLLRISDVDENQRKHEKDLHAANVRRYRANETPYKREQRLQNSSKYKQYVYENEMNEEKRMRQSKDAERKRNEKNSQLQTIPKARTDNPEVEPFCLGAMNIKCQHCSALRFKDENLNCCQSGKIKIDELSPYPDKLKDLLTYKDPESKHFHENIRQYNSAFAFASMGAQIAPPPGYGPYCFRIHGQIYHRSGTLYPSSGQQPKYGQVYIMEASEAVECRMQAKQNVNCKKNVMGMLQTLMDNYSPYAAAYKYMHQVEEEQALCAALDNRIPTSVQMTIKKGKDRRRYNEPTHDEVAAIFVGNDGAPPANRDFVVYPRDQPYTNIKDISSNCDPMVYPLYFPRGDPGWIQGEQHVKAAKPRKRKSTGDSQGESSVVHRNTVTHLQFYSYRLAVRDTFNPIHYGGKLFQQYLVDAYVKMEGNRLEYIRMNQKKLRVEQYKGLMDHINRRAENQNLKAGKVVILPSSYKGSPRAMQQNYQDAMAIVSKFGKPDIFLTYTCNPAKPDIKENLFPKQQPSDRPDIVGRVYNLHLNNLLHDIMKNDVLGKVDAMVRVIEFQKRGLPHNHMLLILNDKDKLRNEDDVDSLICAEIPNQEEDPVLYEVVTTCMMHGPCGARNPKCPCTENGVCTKDYPKEFREETSLGSNSYPEYRRRNDGRTFNKKGVDLDNRDVVPYNKYLCKKYGSHINVEACMSVKSVKYIFKYIYKGHDCASIELKESGQLDHDEISTHLDARYVSPPEAFWHLSGYKMHEQSHAIIRLAVHLPLEQPVYFHDGQEEIALKKAGDKETTLTAWFKLNEKDEGARKYLYPEIPNNYVFDQEHNIWRKRKLGGQKVIGRMYSASPTDSERFHLRLLLLHVPGARSFEDLRTFDGQIVETFKEACRLRQLLEDDTEWDRALEEASTFQMPWQLRLLFATICSHNHPSDPCKLWNKHKESLTEDYLREYSSEDAENLALQYIRAIVEQNRVRYQSLGLPQINAVTTHDEPPDVEADKRYAEDMLQILNEEQREMVDCILIALREIEENHAPKCRAFFLDGIGGSGKTTVYNTLEALLRSKGYHVAASAWTGIAATLLRGGKTVHSTFKLPVPLNENSTSSITPTSTEAARLKDTVMFIIDEASMVSKSALHAIDILLQDITGNRVPFGGKIFVLGGDYRQTLPIVPKARKTAVIENTLLRSHLWSKIKKVHLTKNMRAHQDEQEFAAWLLQLGNGQLKSSCEDVVTGTIDIPEKCIVSGNIIDAVFPDMAANVTRCAILTPKNETTLRLNDEILERVVGEERFYVSIDKVVTDNTEEAESYPLEFLYSQTPSGMPQHVLRLKPGAIIMLLRNLDLRRNLCNGTRLTVHKLHRNVIEADVIGTGQRVLIPRIKLRPSDASLGFQLERLQFPVRKAWAITIDKSQGQTFDRVGIFLPKPVFSHGQLYVAFSRARSFNDVYVKVEETCTQGVIGGVTVTQNIVYPEVLQM